MQKETLKVQGKFSESSLRYFEKAEAKSIKKNGKKRNCVISVTSVCNFLIWKTAALLNTIQRTETMFLKSIEEQLSQAAV